jgi:hypothetical protein
MLNNGAPFVKGIVRVDHPDVNSDFFVKAAGVKAMMVRDRIVSNSATIAAILIVIQEILA